MKNNQLIKFIFFPIYIFGLQLSANTYGNIHEGYFMSDKGTVFRNSVTYFNPFGIPDSQTGTKYFENLQGPQKVTNPVKRAVRNLDEAIAAMLSYSDPEVIAEGKHLQSLAYDLNPTLYIRNGNADNPGGKTPKCVDTDASSLWKLYENNPQFNQVELITIRIEKSSDLAAVVTLTSLQNFASLKYLYILCTFEICSSPGCEATMISKMVQGTDNSDALILFKISVPE